MEKDVGNDQKEIWLNHFLKIKLVWDGEIGLHHSGHGGFTLISSDLSFATLWPWVQYGLLEKNSPLCKQNCLMSEM